MSAPEAPAGPGELSLATIMMVDDEPTTLQIVEEFLRGEGYRSFVPVRDPREAVEVALERRPDVLLLDLIMPHLGGIEVLSALRRHERLQQVPVIILTSSTDARTKLEALELGASDFLSKPVDPTELALRLRNALTARADRERLADYRLHLERKVAERTAELNLMRIAAERASEAKSLFLANMSHEIRTPMTAILGYTDLLIESRGIDGEQLESLEIIKRNGDHLLAIINGILDLSRIEAGGDDFERAPVDLVEVVTEVARTMQVRADARGIDLQVEFPAPLPERVLSDALRLRQALVNLVENAIKFTEEGSVTLRVDWEPDSSTARVDVIDTGIGVAPERIPALFREFEQADATTSRRFGGSGLGLAITHRLAQLLGGSCSMESAVGVGSTLSFCFAAPAAPGAEVREVPEEAQAFREERPALSRPGALRARILLAEDGPDNRRLIERVLRTAGASVESVENGRLAVERLSREPDFDLVVMDMAMPEMDGYTATRTLREQGHELPIVALTAHALEGEREKCLAVGCDEYATKPIDRAALIDVIRASLEKHAAGERARVQPGVLPTQEPPTPKRERRERPVYEADLDDDEPISQRRIDVHKQASILMVDDEEASLDFVQHFLEGEGYRRFRRTSDPAQALPLAREYEPDLLLLDLVMPGTSGLEVLRGLRADPELEHVPVIILTSPAESAAKLQALELGATDFLSKPLDPSELALRLRNSLNAKAHQDRLAYYDALTGLPNRRHFLGRLERIDRVLKRPGAGGLQCAIFLLAIDRLKQINDTLGHRAADKLVKGVASRLASVSREPLSRIAADEFALVLPRSASEQVAVRVSERLLSSLDEPFTLDGRDFFVTASVGIALFPADGDDTDTLIRHANVALSHARAAGENPVQFYRRSLNAEAEDRLRLESELRGALYSEELLLHYQPKVDLRTREIVGAEALMRWEHPELGMLLPATFIPIAEESDLIGSLGDWALREACRQNAAWRARGCRPIGIAVNASGRQFREGFADKIRGLLEETGMRAEDLVIELTESQIMEDPERTASILADLRALGIRISIDDFGTGHSSLSLLKSLPIDELKIDLSFIRGIPGNSDDAAIVTTVITLAHSLGLRVVAEGVETEEQFEFLRERGCDLCQGYLFSRPTAPAEWVAMLEGGATE